VERVNVVIVGGGVVGCAVARAVSRRLSDVFLLEQMPRLGLGASTRNSGVIHSGLYYDPGSLKARHCVRGNQLTYEFCAAHGVPHRRAGKLVVASSAEEEADLEELVERGAANGVEGLRILDRAAIRSREPHIAGRAAIEVPSAGVVSSEELVKAYARQAAEQGASLLTRCRVESLEPGKESVRVRMRTAPEESGPASAEEIVEARCLVNAAGLFSDEVAAMAGNRDYQVHPVRGEYCELVRSKSHLVQALVYPMPYPTGLSLGVHLTRTLWDTVLVGPTARYIRDKNDYESDREPVEGFARRASKLLPEIEPSHLVPAYSGIRAKLVPPGGKGFADFVITRDPQHARVIHLVGIDSPGLTAAISMAEQVAGMVAETLA
jgi:glycerol-3-phosphate dehydrogenase